MRTFTSILIGGAIVLWMAYLSWPVTADVSTIREKPVQTAPAPSRFDRCFCTIKMRRKALNLRRLKRRWGLRPRHRVWTKLPSLLGAEQARQLAPR